MTDFIDFLQPSQDISLAYLGVYDPRLVILSVMSAVFASFMAMRMAERIAYAKTNFYKLLWLAPGALAMGGGVWAMHFIGMLAFSLPCSIHYDLTTTVLSIIPGVLASGVALGIISRHRVDISTIVWGGILMGLGIGTMHYAGMAAMRLDAVIYYDPFLFTLSVVFAVVLAIAALYFKFAIPRNVYFLDTDTVSLVAALVMGTAVSGMHYIAMEAAFFIPVDTPAAEIAGISPRSLALGIGAVTILLVSFGLIAAAFGRYLETIDTLKHTIRERQQAESQVLRLSRAVEQSPAAVMITDLDGHIEYVNPRFTQLTGYGAAEVIGKRPNILKSGHMSQQEYAQLWTTLKRGEEWRGEMHNRRKDGSFYWDFTSISTIRDHSGTPIHLLGIKEDITEAKAATEHLRQAKEDAEYANHVKSQFLASMSHELRTPLNAIIGFSEMILAEVFGAIGNEKYTEYLADIHDSGEHLLELITDILDMSKIESGTLVLHETHVNLTTVVDACRKLVHHRAQDKGVTLEVELLTPPPIVLGDAMRIKQILINLLTNAVKYTPRDGEVSLFFTKSDDGGLDIWVRDSGIGMAAEDIPRALEPFAQVSDIMTSEREGVGLGLFLTRSLLEMHDGRLFIESGVGKGTTVKVRLPQSRVINPGGTVAARD